MISNIIRKIEAATRDMGQQMGRKTKNVMARTTSITFQSTFP